MLGSDLKAFVKHILFEEATTTALVTDPMLTTTLVVANQKVWQRIVHQASSMYAVRSADLTLTVALGYYSLVALSTNGVYRILNVAVKVGDYYVNLTPIMSQDAPQREYLTTFRAYGWYVEGDNLYFSPPIQQDQTFRLTYIPSIADLTDGSHALGGRLVAFHPLVAYEAVLALAVKDEANLSGYKLLRDELYANLVQYLGKRHKQAGRQIRVIREY